MNRRARTFYERAMTAAERTAFDDAQGVAGLGDEIALLRLEVRRLLTEEQPDGRLLQGAMRLLVQAVVAQRRLSGEEAEGLGEAAARLLEEFGAAIAAGDGGGA